VLVSNQTQYNNNNIIAVRLRWSCRTGRWGGVRVVRIIVRAYTGYVHYVFVEMYTRLKERSYNSSQQRLPRKT
jgi:hypothetical protein